VACIPGREDPRDVVVAPRHGTLDALPRGARVGTSSLRRAVVVLSRRPDLQIVPMRGNVDTRMKKVDAGECDAILLARAGLVRLGIDARATEVLPVDVSLPAPGQGALGIECRIDDEATRELLSTLHDTAVGMCIAAERGVLEALGGDCKTPLGAHAERVDGKMRVRAFIARPDGSGLRHGESTVDWPPSDEGARDAGLALGATLR
jgi:hydroxymethylbilane synthase